MGENQPFVVSTGVTTLTITLQGGSGGDGGIVCNDSRGGGGGGGYSRITYKGLVKAEARGGDGGPGEDGDDGPGDSGQAGFGTTSYSGLSGGSTTPTIVPDLVTGSLVDTFSASNPVYVTVGAGGAGSSDFCGVSANGADGNRQ